MNFSYLKYVLRHKWYVFVAMRKWKKYRLLMLWRAIIHDWQKFTPAEWSPYANSFYGPYEYDKRPQKLVNAFNKAWLHHIHHGPHHWEYWVLEDKPLEIPPAYVQEMVADWSGAGMAIHGNPDPYNWYYKNKDNIILHKDTRADVEYLLNAHLFGGTYDKN